MELISFHMHIGVREIRCARTEETPWTEGNMIIYSSNQGNSRLGGVGITIVRAIRKILINWKLMSEREIVARFYMK